MMTEGDVWQRKSVAPMRGIKVKSNGVGRLLRTNRGLGKKRTRPKAAKR